MLQIPFERGDAAVKMFLQSMLDQHHTDIMRLMKRVAELQGSGSFGGSTDTGSYNISQQFERYVRLTSACHSGSTGGSSATGVVQQLTSGVYGDTTDPAAYPDLAIGADGAVVVNGYFMSGYAFAEEIVRVRFDLPTGIWLVQDNGHHMVRGALAAQLNNGSSASVTLARGGAVTGYEVLGLASPVTNGNNVWLTWNKDTSRFEVVSAEC